MHDNEFFREVTLQICGNLDIEKAMFTSFHIINKVMPLQRMYLQEYNRSFSSMQLIATATENEYSKMDILVPLSENARKPESMSGEYRLQNVYLYKDPYNNIIVKELLSFLDIKCTSLMVMLLGSPKKILGALVLITDKKEKYTEKHAKLLELLNEPFTIALSNTLKHREISKLKDLLADDNRYLSNQLKNISGTDIIGANYGLKDIMKNVLQVAKLDSPVLLLGETGTGKDVIANYIHQLSPRNNQPFINVNCGAIPETLIDSELFGHEKGSFTGAFSQKRGRFERAHKGTIFLDEIGELPLLSQVRLLHVLQNKKIERVGGTKTIELDIRIIAATNKNLQQMINEKEFREDLWFRLNVFPITIPPLRERKIDIPALLQYFIDQKSKELKLPAIPSIALGSIDILTEYPWPGNVRELQNIVERALIINPEGPVNFDHLSPQSNSSQNNISVESEEIIDLDEAMTHHIRNILAKTDGQIHGSKGAADLLGINPSTLRNRMNKLGIRYGKNK